MLTLIPCTGHSRLPSLSARFRAEQFDMLTCAACSRAMAFGAPAGKARRNHIIDATGFIAEAEDQAAAAAHSGWRLP